MILNSPHIQCDLFPETVKLLLANIHWIFQMHTNYFDYIGLSRRNVVSRAWWAVTSVLLKRIIWQPISSSPAKLSYNPTAFRITASWIAHLRIASQETTQVSVRVFQIYSLLSRFSWAQKSSLRVFREWMLAFSTLSHAGFSAALVCRKSSLKDTQLDSNAKLLLLVLTVIYCTILSRNFSFLFSY